MRTELSDHETHIEHRKYCTDTNHIPMPATDEDKTEDGTNDDQSRITEYFHLTEIGMHHLGYRQRKAFTRKHQHIAFHFQRNAVGKQSRHRCRVE